jgi:hypothetical protein
MHEDQELSTAVTRQVTISMTPDQEADDSEIERSVRVLYRELRELDLESISYAQGSSAPSGSKGDITTWTELLVTLGSVGGVLPALFDAITGWLARQRGRNRISVTIDGDTLELDAATQEERSELIDAFVGRHSM